MDDFPGNSRREKESNSEIPSRKKNAETKKVERIVTGEVTRRKKSLGRRFKETFVGGDTKGVVNYIVVDVFIPAAKDMFADAGVQFIERMIFGEARSRRPRGGWGPSGGSNNWTPYNRYSSSGSGGSSPWSRRNEPRREITSRARETHDFDEIILQSRGEAEDVLDGLRNLIEQYDSAGVDDLYHMTNIRSTFVDEKWGWTNLRGARVERVRGGGYLLSLPNPEPLD